MSAEGIGLYTARGWKRRSVRVSGASLEEVRAVPIPMGDPHTQAWDRPPPAGHDVFELQVPVVLDPLPAPRRYAGVFVRVSLDDQRVNVQGVQRYPEAAQGDLPVTAEETVGAAAGVFFGHSANPRQPGVRDGRYGLRVVLTVPVDLPDLSGTVRVDTTFAHHGWLLRRPRLEHAHGDTLVRFTMHLPDERVPAVPVSGADPAHPHDRRPSVRLCLAADIERFSRFRTPEAARAQERFVGLLAEARRHAGIPDGDVDPQESGDGRFEVFPAPLDEASVIPRLVEGLRDALARTNADLNAHARLRIRVALHRGHLHHGVNGWVGESAIAVHRLLDSGPLRRALTDHQKADLALIVPDVLYRDVIGHGYGGLPPDRFRPVHVRIPEKRFEEPAWIYVPD